MTVGHLYLLTNSHVPKLVKIGYTNRTPELRAAQLSGVTGVPGKWVVHASWELEGADKWEKAVFQELRRLRETGEFFRITPTDACHRITTLLYNGGVLDASGLTPTARKRVEIKEAKEADKQRVDASMKAVLKRCDQLWESGWDIHIKPWRDNWLACQKFVAQYERPGFLWFGPRGWEHLSNWSGYPKLLERLPLALRLSRNARAFILAIKAETKLWSSQNDNARIWWTPADWDLQYPGF